MPAERREPALGHLAGLVEDAFFQPGQPGLDQPDRARLEGCDAQQRTARGRHLGAAANRLGGRGERDDLDRGDHLPRLDDRERRQSAEGDRLIDEVEPVDPPGLENQDPARLGKKVGAAGERCRRLDLGSRCRRGDPPRRFVLADIVGFEPGDDNPRQAGGGDQLEVVR